MVQQKRMRWPLRAKAVSCPWALMLRSGKLIQRNAHGWLQSSTACYSARGAHQMALAVAARHLRTLPGLQLPRGRAHWLQASPRWAELALAPLQRCCSPAPPPCLQ